jgi:hypothetical protein
MGRWSTFSVIGIKVDDEVAKLFVWRIHRTMENVKEILETGELIGLEESSDWCSDGIGELKDVSMII